jgi:DNA gyrase subunit A
LIDVKLTRGSIVENDEIKDPGDDVVLITREGMSIRFHEADVRSMGRAAGGVRGISLEKNRRGGGGRDHRSRRNLARRRRKRHRQAHGL